MKRRYLTPSEKAEQIAAWHQQRADFENQRPTLNRDPAGLGFPDPEIYNLTDRLNAIEGVCTVQSCSGHVIGIQDVQWNANLWLRLSEPITEQFLECVSDLTEERPAVERVALVFGPPEGEIVEIVFEGLNVGAEAFAEAGDIIVAFFLRLEALVRLRSEKY